MTFWTRHKYLCNASPERVTRTSFSWWPISWNVKLINSYGIEDNVFVSRKRKIKKPLPSKSQMDTSRTKQLYAMNNNLDLRKEICQFWWTHTNFFLLYLYLFGDGYLVDPYPLLKLLFPLFECIWFPLSDVKAPSILFPLCWSVCILPYVDFWFCEWKFGIGGVLFERCRPLSYLSFPDCLFLPRSLGSLLCLFREFCIETSSALTNNIEEML